VVTVIAALYVLGARLFAFAFTEKYTVVPLVSELEEEEKLSQFGTPEIE
jgi:hypothetical protein